MNVVLRTEDEVRDGFTSGDGFIDGARQILGLDEPEENVKQGTGQVTTFNQLGFAKSNDRPDGWYLPNDKSLPAIILETKPENEDIYKEKWEKELFKNIKIANQKYKQVIGILYNGKDVRVFKLYDEVLDCSKELQRKEYYLSLYLSRKVDKGAIYTLTKRINDTLHFKFGIKNLYHRMIFTACALVSVKEGAVISTGMDYNDFHNAILNQLNKSLKKSKKMNNKLQLLADIYTEIKMNSPDNQEAIDNFIGWIKSISEYVTSDNWNGEDVMGIFFNEFNRYKAKSEKGQVFTPDHITSFVYRIVHCDMDDRVLDASCGSGAFLVKSMCNMIKESGGVNTKKAKEIKDTKLYGIEWDREIFALACANMLIHKDGKTNLELLDTREQEACDCIKGKNITKVMMNPPHERKYGCMKIVENVLNNVPKGIECAFILPDKKLENELKDKKYGNKLLKTHTLKKIVKLPEKTFTGVGVNAATSIFIFEANVPHNNKHIFACYISDDGLETVKNQGRQDVNNRWQEIEDRWVNIIENPLLANEMEKLYIQMINPAEHLSYQVPAKDFEIYEEDFIKSMMDYEMYKRSINVRDFGESLIKKALYNSNVTSDESTINISMKGDYVDD